MKDFNFEFFLRLVLVGLFVIVALALLISEPNGCDTLAKWLVVFLASKFGAMACFWLVYHLCHGMTIHEEYFDDVEEDE